jgi:hypothetical protein
MLPASKHLSRKRLQILGYCNLANSRSGYQFLSFVSAFEPCFGHHGHQGDDWQGHLEPELGAALLLTLRGGCASKAGEHNVTIARMNTHSDFLRAHSSRPANKLHSDFALRTCVRLMFFLLYLINAETAAELAHPGDIYFWVILKPRTYLGANRHRSTMGRIPVAGPDAQGPSHSFL